MSALSDRIKSIIKLVPSGRVATYGQLAAMAGNFRAARLVAWILHSSSAKHNLPWHRIISSRGRISLATDQGYHQQKKKLTAEGISFSKGGRIDFNKFLWDPGTSDKS